MDSDGVSVGRNALESSLTQLNKEHVDVLVRLWTQTQLYNDLIIEYERAESARHGSSPE